MQAIHGGDVLPKLPDGSRLLHRVRPQFDKVREQYGKQPNKLAVDSMAVVAAKELAQVCVTLCVRLHYSVVCVDVSRVDKLVDCDV